MSGDLTVLSITAVSIGFFHTLFGPDHYLPFIVMGKARNWSIFKISAITFVCGIGHIMSSVVLGLVGVALGIFVGKLESIESVRGELAGWALIVFGLLYLVWGVRQAVRNRPHTHLHIHGDDVTHQHVHTHHDGHLHPHVAEGKKSITPWMLFTIFVLGPCEPLIPILMYPAAEKSLFGLVWVASLFGLTTIGTMMVVVLISSYGLNLLPLGKLERYTHALAGGTIFLSGMAIQFLGL